MSYLILCVVHILHHSNYNRKFLSKLWCAKWVKSLSTEGAMLIFFASRVKAFEFFQFMSVDFLNRMDGGVWGAVGSYRWHLRGRLPMLPDGDTHHLGMMLFSYLFKNSLISLPNCNKSLISLVRELHRWPCQI